MKTRFFSLSLAGLLLASSAWMPSASALEPKTPVDPKLPVEGKLEKDCKDEKGKDACLLCCAKKARVAFKDCLTEIGQAYTEYCKSEANLFQTACNANCDNE